MTRLAVVQSPARRAGLYVRISKDRAGDQLGVTRQLHSGREVLARLGWSEVDVYRDNDLSISDYRTPRPEYDRLLADVAAGRIDAIVAWDSIRIYRHPVALERLIEFVEEHDVAIETVTAGDVDLTTPEGRYFARNLGAYARMEIEKMAARGKLKHAELIRGGWWRGGQAPYGYRLVHVIDAGAKRTTLAVIEDQADVIRLCAGAVLAGRSLLSIEAELNAEGFAPPRPARDGTPGRWYRETVRDLLIRPTVAGRVSSDGQDAGPAQWPAVLPFDEWLLVRDVLTDSSRKVTREPTRSLLTGLVYKAGTDYRLTIHMGPKPLHRRMYYLHRTQVPAGEVGVSIDAERLEEYVRDFLFDALDARGPLPVEEEPTPEAGVLADIEARLAQAAEDEASGVMTRAEWLRKQRVLMERRKAALTEAKAAKRFDRATAERLAEPGRLRADWPAMTFEQKRRALKDLIERVNVTPSNPSRRHRFDSSRVKVRLAD